MVAPPHTVFNRPPLVGRELEYIADALERGHLSGDGHYAKLCEEWLARTMGSVSARLTHSCTGALEMAAILAEVGPGDEVIMPSFTFSSTANAFVLRGAVPVFVDIRPDTLNIDERLIEPSITSRTKAIAVTHYAGVCCEMRPIRALAQQHGLIVIEDAAQALMSTYEGQPAGSLSSLACISFHETKNLGAGEGGAILVNEERFTERADIIREKGTTRVAFRKRLVDKYTWVDIGSSYLPGEITAAFLWAQLEAADAITERRLLMWARYHDAFARLEETGRLRRPIVPGNCTANGHIYYLLMRDRADRDALIAKLAEEGILAPFHYVPLHSSPAGLRYGRFDHEMPHTDDASNRLVRLPLFDSLGDRQDLVIASIFAFLENGT